jgi:hypothetical protein
LQFTAKTKIHESKRTNKQTNKQASKQFVRDQAGTDRQEEEEEEEEGSASIDYVTEELISRGDEVTSRGA